MLRAAVLAALFALALAFQAPALHPGLRGRVRAKARLGACQAHMRADRHGCRQAKPAGRSSSLQALQALHRRAVLQLPAMAVLAAPLAAQAKEKKKGGTQAGEAAKYESISLDDFYAALEDQEVLKVEFDGPKFEKCFVFMNDGQIFLVGEGYPVESSVSSVGPQSVVGRIKNEIKAGNPVTWSWRGAGAFKKFAPKKEVLVDKSEGNLSAEQAKRAKAKGEKQDNGGLFGFLSPPKKLSTEKKVAATEDSEDEE